MANQAKLRTLLLAALDELDEPDPQPPPPRPRDKRYALLAAMNTEPDRWWWHREVRQLLPPDINRDMSTEMWQMANEPEPRLQRENVGTYEQARYRITPRGRRWVERGLE